MYARKLNNKGKAKEEREDYFVLTESLSNSETTQCKFSKDDVVQREDDNTSKINSESSNKRGIPDQLKSGLESLSGYDLSSVQVHYNSSKPKQLGALAYAQGANIHLSAGQEKHLPHEGWHVVQQMQGRVKPTLQMKGNINVNDDLGLEREADLMGTRALQKNDCENQNRASQKSVLSAGSNIETSKMAGSDVLSCKPQFNDVNGHNIVQRLPMTVNNRRYDDLEIERMRQTISAVEGDVVYPLFDKSDNKAWYFANDTAFYKFMAVLYTVQWDGNTQSVPIEQSIYRRSRNGTIPGTVVINKIVYNNADELIESDILSRFRPIKQIVLDEKLMRLARDPINKWNFNDWKDLSVALESWDGEGPYSTTLKEHRSARRPDSKKSKWDPTLVTEENALEIESTFNNVWQVCGQTATYMISRVHDLLGDVTLEYEKELGANNVGELLGILNGDVDTLTLMNIGNPLLHEFTIEKRPKDQAAILHQGYISAYNSLWWAGLEDSLISLAETPKQAISSMRVVYGGSQKIDIPTLSANLADFMSAPSINSDQAQSVWKKLPFNPLVAPNSEAKPNLIVSVWHVNDPTTVLDELESTLKVRDEWVTTAVQREVLSVYKKILIAKG